MVHIYYDYENVPNLNILLLLLSFCLSSARESLHTQRYSNKAFSTSVLSKISETGLRYFSFLERLNNFLKQLAVIGFHKCYLIRNLVRKYYQLRI